MKLNKIICTSLAFVALSACSALDEALPEGGTVLDSQLKEINAALPTRAEAEFLGMFTKMGNPLSVFGARGSRPDDFGFVMIAFSNDLEAADVIVPASGYNWFSVCGELSSRNADYANPYIRYAAPYNTIADANKLISSFADSENQEFIYMRAQAMAIRAFAYLNLAPYFQFGYATAADQPCVPLVTEATENFADNPRASVKEIYEQIISDLTYAIEHLEGYTRPDKSKIDRNVAYGLRARAYLYMGKGAEAAADAEKAMEGYTPATMKELAKPAFYDIQDHNWIWGYDMTKAIAETMTMATSSSWIRSLSGEAYSTATQCYSCCNQLLYDKIPDTDIRKGWWVNEDLVSPLLSTLIWKTSDGQVFQGDEVASEDITVKGEVVKVRYLPYTNVKFGMFTVGGVTNEEDWPFMRVEEMILTQAEGYAISGNEGKARQILDDFVSSYRNPEYSSAASGRNLRDEIWFQRRVELWGEGFANADTRRLGKPLVRFHGGKPGNCPEPFRFNLTPDDGWWLMRFCTSELDTNKGVIDNTGGMLPVQDQNPGLRDGVTD